MPKGCALRVHRAQRAECLLLSYWSLLALFACLLFAVWLFVGCVVFACWLQVACVVFVCCLSVLVCLLGLLVLLVFYAC